MRGNYTEVRAALPVSLSLQKSTVDKLRTLGDTPSGLYPGVTSGHEPPNCMESEALQGKHVALQGTKNSEEDSKREEELKPVEQLYTVHTVRDTLSALYPEGTSGQVIPTSMHAEPTVEAQVALPCAQHTMQESTCEKELQPADHRVPHLVSCDTSSNGLMRGNYTEVRAALPVSLSLQKSTVDKLRTLGDTPSGLYPGVTSGHEPPNCMESEALQGKHVALQGTKNSEEDSKREEELKPVEQLYTVHTVRDRLSALYPEGTSGQVIPTSMHAEPTVEAHVALPCVQHTMQESTCEKELQPADHGPMFSQCFSLIPGEREHRAERVGGPRDNVSEVVLPTLLSGYLTWSAVTRPATGS
ncbi:uncharacterized protein LOC132532856 [Erinaceus europaeus]|uniref:Uncharacterized protein LOC132532856 n=1 Tax=Erinaceus europaeus TaxID=9365 RepID=A0ABM3VV62_ERIEU|nr:uncharacterized protein LOC132532856 [Erinaceus europaeus]